MMEIITSPLVSNVYNVRKDTLLIHSDILVSKEQLLFQIVYKWIILARNVLSVNPIFIFQMQWTNV